jgi:hypothetical protein
MEKEHKLKKNTHAWMCTHFFFVIERIGFPEFNECTGDFPLISNLGAVPSDRGFLWVPAPPYG